ncbi:LytTR family DNA-binding domain-containing protein [Emticicia sp. BO119]|uniref:LytTR family DNA-binding domain-containing protein n=1 Tax=Emticicia sp. BO119 TaxID=2757768 RepID=UPI0015EFF38F|nr:LytTR family DNA-binding domain-containing protein [Emticicia sp. BO119]MBA4852406.1 LytTR family transcriptional regulator [Emticicia sp. BO119]
MEKLNTIHLGGRKELPPEQIVMLKADSNYTNVYLQNGTSFIVATNLGELARRVKHLAFFRPNRSIVINLEHLKLFNTEDLQIEMQNEEVVSLSRRRTKKFKRYYRVFSQENPR